MSIQILFTCLLICLLGRESFVAGQLEPSAEAQVLIKHMMKSMKKNLPKMMEKVNISAIAGPACNQSWHQYMIENDLTAEKFSGL